MDYMQNENVRSGLYEKVKMILCRSVLEKRMCWMKYQIQSKGEVCVTKPERPRIPIISSTTWFQHVEKMSNNLKPVISLDDASEIPNLHLEPYIFTCSRNNTAAWRGSARSFMLQNTYWVSFCNISEQDETGCSHGRNNEGWMEERWIMGHFYGGCHYMSGIKRRSKGWGGASLSKPWSTQMVNKLNEGIYNFHSLLQKTQNKQHLVRMKTRSWAK